MNNRNLSSRVLFVAALSLAVNPLLRSQVQTGDPETGTLTTTEPATPTSPLAASPKVAVPLLSYTVVHGDTLGSIAHKCGLTIAQLKRLNDLPETKVSIKPGEVLQVVYVKGAPTGAKTAAAAKKKIHVASTNPTTYPLAQPVQNFDMPPAGAAAGANSAATDQSIGSAPVLSYKSAPVAKLVSPAELTLDESEPNTAVTRAATAPSVNDGTNTDTDATASNASSKRAAKVTYAAPIPSVTSPAATRTAAATPANHSGMHFWNPFYTAPATDWGQRFLQQARALGDMGLEYDEDWRPPGESHTWAMDCSNTARYLYKVTAGIELPRTASDQYYYLHLQGKAWDVPQGPNGFADTNYLRQYLKPGDLLFWENTYRPDRQPPITHVMVFLGTNTQGQWIMAGSQSSRGGEHNRRNGGPDIYVFRPSQPCGGYTTWLGFVHHQGRFCAFGRPLEADRSKLSVAADN